MDEASDLRDQLAELLSLASSVDTSGSPSWQVNAIGTICENTARYLASLEAALRAGDAEAQIQAACRVSGIRKGVSDLGFPPTDPLVDLADRIDSKATLLCSSARLARHR